MPVLIANPQHPPSSQQSLNQVTLITTHHTSR